MGHRKEIIRLVMAWGISITEDELRIKFPNLRPENFEKRSLHDPFYNCIGFAGHDRENWWWPSNQKGAYWPNGDTGLEVETFIRAFASFGYERCESADYEEHYEKVAIYSLGGNGTHMARQIKRGLWVSKLGQIEDIAHLTLQCLEGPEYGKAKDFMRRLHLGA